MQLLSTPSKWDYKSLQMALCPVPASFKSKLGFGGKNVWFTDIFGNFGIAGEGL